MRTERQRRYLHRVALLTFAVGAAPGVLVGTVLGLENLRAAWPADPVPRPPPITVTAPTTAALERDPAALERGPTLTLRATPTAARTTTPKPVAPPPAAVPRRSSAPPAPTAPSTAAPPSAPPVSSAAPPSSQPG